MAIPSLVKFSLWALTIFLAFIPRFLCSPTWKPFSCGCTTSLGWRDFVVGDAYPWPNYSVLAGHHIAFFRGSAGAPFFFIPG